MITLRDLNGSERQVPDGQPYIKKPTEEVIKGSGGSHEENRVLDTLGKIAQSKGLQVGDMVARLTHAFGIPPCSRCEQRRQVLNKIAEQGVLKTLQLLKEIH
mgnify:FL=1